MPVLTDSMGTLPEVPGDFARDVAAALQQTPKYLVAHLSGGAGTWYTSASSKALPRTMMRPVTFDDTEAPSELQVVAGMSHVDEEADEW